MKTEMMQTRTETRPVDERYR